MPFFSFKPVKRPKPKFQESTLDEALQKSADDANLTLYMINMVVESASDLPNVDFGFDLTDPYCEVIIADDDSDGDNDPYSHGLRDRTPVIMNDLNPVWNETMNFFVATKPKSMLLQIKDVHTTKVIKREDTKVGSAVFEFGSFFELGGEFRDDLPLKTPNGKQKGSVRIHVKCRTLKPVETEIKLSYATQELKLKEEQQLATDAALDESEQLRKEVIDELSKKEQEILKKADELAESVELHHQELSEKDQEILNKAQQIEAKIQEKEEAEVARREAELKKLEAETKLTQAERELLQKAKQLVILEKTNAEEMSAKDREILRIADQLKDKERAHATYQERLERTEALKVEVENELTAKERIIQEQANQIKQMVKNQEHILSEKEKEILKKSKGLEERERLAAEAQEKQDEAKEMIQKLKDKCEILEELDLRSKKAETQLCSAACSIM